MKHDKNIVIRITRLSDFEEIFSLWQKAGLDLVNKDREFADFKNIIKTNPSSCFVLTINHKIIGCILATFNGRRAWIYHLAIDPLFQNQGYGTFLLERAEKELKKQGAYRVNLGVLYTNLRIVPFYKKLGYSVMTDAIFFWKNI